MSQRGSDKGTGFLFAQPGEERLGCVAAVAPVLPAAALGSAQRLYTFAVPAALEIVLAPGQRVRVPIGRRGRLVEGFVAELGRRAWDTTLRPIDSVLDDVSYLTPELLRLGRWISEYYVCPLGRVYKAMVPASVHDQAGLVRVRYLRVVSGGEEVSARKTRVSSRRKAVMQALQERGDWTPALELMQRTGAGASLLRSMAEDGWVEFQTRREEEPRGTSPVENRCHTLPCHTLPLSDPAGADDGAPGGERRATSFSPRSGEPPDSPRSGEPPSGEPPQEPASGDFELTDEQRAALEVVRERMRRGEFSATLVYGVSGSGKTEVYIRAMREVVEAGRQAMLLVPEIMLTTQLVRRLAARFAEVAVLHSGLSASQRSIEWRRIAAGRAPVIIGTRSAVFAPCPDLGLICVDEEQETSFKNLQAPRFHVRDAAIMRAHQRGIAVILGSATPSLESWHNSVHHPSWQRAVLRRRVRRRPMPFIHLVDMNTEGWATRHDTILSRLLEGKLVEALARGEQAVILMNRRGYATRVFCPQCRTRLACPRCSVGLVVHKVRGRAMCHYCGQSIPLPDRCPNVNCAALLLHAGSGTQRVEEALKAALPAARIRRVDRDTMRHRRTYGEVVGAFERREIDVLIGTQMVAKGLDFPHVSLVGVLNADGLAAVPDFRNQEYLFQLITQVAGRAGRGDVPGEVVVQAMSPDLPALRLARDHDYESFAAAELRLRQVTGFPPAVRLTRFIVEDPSDGRAEEEALGLAQRLRAWTESNPVEGAVIVGPSPCALARVRGRYRYDVLLKTRSHADTQRILSAAQTDRTLRVKARTMVIDVDPVVMA